MYIYKHKKLRMLFGVCTLFLMLFLQKMVIYSFEQNEFQISQLPDVVEYTNQENVQLTIQATDIKNPGSTIHYQWESLFPWDSSWTNWGGEGCNTATTSYVIPKEWDGLKLRCIISDDNGNTLTSNEATLKYQSSLTINREPEDQEYSAGEKVRVSVEATDIKNPGSTIHYQWESLFPWDSSWTNWGGEGCNTATTSYVIPKEWDGLKLRCKVFDDYGNCIVSSFATIQYLEEPNISISYLNNNYSEDVRIPYGIDYKIAITNGDYETAVLQVSSDNGSTYTDIDYNAQKEYLAYNDTKVTTIKFFRIVGYSEKGHIISSKVVKVTLLNEDETPIIQ